MCQSQKTDGKLYIAGLDGIRAIAFLLVFAAHAGMDKWIPGGLGVTIFFFLSGYLITTLLRREALATGTVSLRQFYIRRAIRILPPLYLILIAVGLLSLAGVMCVLPSAFSYVAAVGFFTNYYSMLPGRDIREGPGMETLWSLCIEEHFYLVFPCLYRYFLRRRIPPHSQASILLAGCAVALAWRLAVVLVFHEFSGTGPKWTYTTTDCRFDSILWGAILAIHNNAWFKDRDGMLLSRYKGAFAAIGVAGLLASLLYRHPVFRETLRYSLQGIALYPIFYYCIAAGQSWIVRILETKALRSLGALSYCLYLCHLYILWEFRSRHAGVQLFSDALVSLGLAVAFAWIMRHSVELPLQRLRTALSRSPRLVVND